jgi:threonine/homoserine/homoserine lactone efflux protein
MAKPSGIPGGHGSAIDNNAIMVLIYLAYQMLRSGVDDLTERQDTLPSMR